MLFYMLLCVATAVAACLLFLKSDHTNLAGLLTFVSMTSCAKLIQEIEEGDSPYERGLEEANLVLTRNRRAR